jgi:hypothetical protein
MFYIRIFRYYKSFVFMYMLKYHPHKSDNPNKKYYIITNNNKKVYFGAAGMVILPTTKIKQEHNDI